MQIIIECVRVLLVEIKNHEKKCKIVIFVVGLVINIDGQKVTAGLDAVSVM